MALRFLLALGVLFSVGCSASVPPVRVVPTAQTATRARPVVTAALLGKVKAPGDLLAAAGIVGHNGASYRLAEAPADWATVPGATVRLLDAFGARVAGVPEVQTDVQGNFRLDKVPVGQGFVIEVVAGTLTLKAIARASTDEVAVDPATTVLVAHLAAVLTDTPGAFARVPEARFTALAGLVRDVLVAGKVPLAVGSDAQAGATFDAIVGVDAAVGQGGSDLAKDTRAALGEALASEPPAASPGPSASPSSAPSPSTPPTASPSTTPTTSPTPSSSPTASPSSSPTASPSSSPKASPSSSPSSPPTASPSSSPTASPSSSPTASPSSSPTASPSSSPSSSPTASPSASPSSSPKPSSSPSASPSSSPSASPSTASTTAP